jgi:16S rRNA (guanine(966)-N(2))-methyltransferase RsmD
MIAQRRAWAASGYAVLMLRIISGQYRRRLLATPPDADTTRPFPDRVRESLFQILRGHYEGATVFEAFAGVGSVGLEAVSRGAARVVMVERDRAVFSLLEKNVATLGCQDKVELVCGDALGPGALARCPRPVHLVFFDPPYAMVRDPSAWGRIKGQFERLIAMLDDTGYAVLRTPWPLYHEFTPDGKPVVHEETPTRKGGRTSAKGEPPKHRHDDDEPEKGGVWLSAEEIEDAFDRAVDNREDDDGEDAEPAAEEPSPEETPKNRREPVDLHMTGARGPETHEYTGMAVHLYMRKSDAVAK